MNLITRLRASFVAASSWVLRCILYATNKISRQPTHYSNMAQIRIV